MAIPAAQLQTWCNQGAVTTAQATHTSVRYALETAHTSLVLGRDIEIFLQGSYRNVTNIYSDSDVDIVVQLNETFTHDTSILVGPTKIAIEGAFNLASPAPYPWVQFRLDVIESLQRHYGHATVQPGNKAIKLLAAPGRLAADIVPAVVHRVYTSPGGVLTQPTSIEGISFWDQTARFIVNFPKQHIDNGQAKNGILRTGGEYKTIVRMVKNARRYLVEKNYLTAGAAPSYFVECLLYNVPDHLFVADRQLAMRGILEWLQANSMTLFTCQNAQMFLFGPTPEQWNEYDANKLVASLIHMWNHWPI